MEIDKLTHQIIGCAMEVHNVLRSGFQEVIYQRALAKELKVAGIAFAREFSMPIHYKGDVLGDRRVDFFIEGCLMVELKAVSQLDPVHKAQAINYLEAFNIKNGLLINFGGPKLEYHRLFNNKIT